MQVNQSANIERIGVSFVQLAFERMGYLFREQAINDYGIDAQVEIVKDGKATGRLIALQIKSGPSWFEEKNQNRVVFRGSATHRDYWLSHSLPVVVILYDSDNATAYWQVVNNDTIISTGKGWKLEVPLMQKVDEASKPAFEKLVGTPVSTPGQYTILSLRDVSHAAAKRYSANILVPEHFTKTEIVRTIQEATNNLKQREYYRNDRVKQQWGGKSAQVIFLFIYQSLGDVRMTNWICRSLWTDEELPSQFAPLRFAGEEVNGRIVVDWSDNYSVMKKLREQHSLAKEDFLAQMEVVLNPLYIEVDKAIEFTYSYERGTLSTEIYVQTMARLEAEVTRLYMQATHIGLAPVECKDVDNRFHGLLTFAHNVVFPFSGRGLQTWKEKNRRYLVRQAIEDYQKEKVRLEFEIEKIH